MLARLVAVALAATLTTGCIGKFAAFNGVQRWNKGMGNRYVASAVHIALWIVPVYELCLLGDLIIFNTIEFWGGSNPIAMQVEEAGPGHVKVAVEGRSYDLRQRPDGAVAIEADGEVLAIARAGVDGGWVLEDVKTGRVIALDAARVEQIQQAMAQAG